LSDYFLPRIPDGWLEILPYFLQMAGENKLPASRKARLTPEDGITQVFRSHLLESYEVRENEPNNPDSQRLSYSRRYGSRWLDSEAGFWTDSTRPCHLYVEEGFGVAS